MFQQPGEPRLVEEDSVREPGGLGGGGDAPQLDGDRTFREGVVGEIDHPHRTSPDGREQFVFAELAWSVSGAAFGQGSVWAGAHAVSGQL